MSLFFITGNKNKFNEVESILGDRARVEQLDIDLPEIQEIDARKIIQAKLEEAFKHYPSGSFIIEDTSLYLDCLKGLPGPLIKWFLQAIGREGLVELTKKLNNDKAEARTIIAYAKNREEVEFFEGAVLGKIVPQVRDSNFGWDPIFQPDGYDKTFAEMTSQEKNQISMRKIATEKLGKFLSN